MKDNEIIKALECCSGDGGKYDCHRCPNFKDYIDCKEDLSACALDLINCQKAKIAVLSVENANLKICVGDLNAELENKNVEIDILIRKKKSLRDEISELTAENEKRQNKISELQHGILNCKSEAIKEFAEFVFSLFPVDKNHTTISRFTIKQKLKEMVGEEK